MQVMRTCDAGDAPARYPGSVRTTLAIDDVLLEGARRRAKERDETLGEYVEECLRLASAWMDRPRPRRVLPFPTFDGGGFAPEFQGLTASRIIAKLDDDLPLDKQR